MKNMDHLRFFTLSVVWVIIGVVVMAAGIFLSGSSDYYGSNLVFNGGILVGTILMVFGGIASIFKVVGDMLEDSRKHQY